MVQWADWRVTIAGVSEISTIGSATQTASPASLHCHFSRRRRFTRKPLLRSVPSRADRAIGEASSVPRSFSSKHDDHLGAVSDETIEGVVCPECLGANGWHEKWWSERDPNGDDDV